MRLVTLRTDGGTRAARIQGDAAIELDYPDVGALLGAGPSWSDIASGPGGNVHALADADLAPLVVDPPKIICLGLNYATHIDELGRDRPEHPTLFAKYTRSLIGPRDPIVLPSVSDQVDWEVELTIVIGRETRHADPDEASEAIAGYTILNDVSVRDWQWRTTEWLQGKTFEDTTPLGPALVTPDEVDGARDLEVSCEVDGDVRQQSRTSDLLFKPADVVSYLSDIMTLDPGDVIATGTPGGVGMGRKPPLFLAPGQVVRTRIEGLGELVNECVKET
jgi:acylpyruvate hydrolase